MKLRIAAVLIALLGLAGCATPEGMRDGMIGGAGGAIIGGAAGGLPGAIIGGTAGGLLGGAYGDQQTYRYYGGPGRPCYIYRVPVYDRYGYVIGYRHVCR